MCAFMPASANWIDRMPRRWRHSNSGRHADGAARGFRIARGDRVEVLIREHDVEPLEKRRIAERRRGHRAAHGERHAQVQAIEPPQPVGPGQLALERRHDVHDLGDGRRAAALDDSLSIDLLSPLPGARTLRSCASSSFAAALSLPVARLA